MATKIISITYQLKRGLQSVIEAKNPILAEGEPIVIFCNDGSTKLKIGDGKTPYSELTYVGGTITQDPDSGEIVQIEIDSTLSEDSTNPVENRIITKALKDKVDKIEGKGLSSNDYSDEDKSKLAAIESGATRTIIDARLDATSTNPPQNAVVTKMFTDFDTKLSNLIIDGGEIV